MSALFTNSFFEAFMSQNNTNSALSTLIAFLSSRYPHLQSKFQNIDLQRIADTFDKVGCFFAVTFNVIERAENIEVVKEMTFCQIFQSLQLLNVHQDIVNDGKNYSCEYHTEELFDHLILCGLISCIEAINMEIDPFIATLAGILHDIGKLGCIHIFANDHIGYPFHGEFGAIILARIYSKSFEQFVSKEMWELICRLLTVHMCSYHLVKYESYWEQSRVNSCRFEDDITKSYLIAMSHGDVFAALSIKAQYAEFIDSRPAYVKEISKPFVCNRNKFVITLDGLSGSGKSTVADMLRTWFVSQHISVGYIARDDIMCKHVAGMMNISLTNERPTNEEYATCFAYYKLNGLGKIINKQMQFAICDSIDANMVTLVDTQLTLFKYSSAIIPDNISECVVISIDVNRNALSIDDKKNGIDLTSQLKLSGNSSFLKPFDVSSMDVFRLQSKYCSKIDNLTPGAVDYKFQICSNTGFDGLNSIGLESFKSLFMKIYTTVDSSNPTGFSLDKTTLTKLVNDVYNSGDRNYAQLGMFFNSVAVLCSCPVDFRETPYSERIILLKYKEHNTDWRECMRDTRGTAFYLNDAGFWIPIKYLMQRGAEILTGMHLKSGITQTENIDLSSDYKCSRLSPKQQGLVVKMATGGSVNLKATMKKDGSLFVVTAITGEFAAVLREIITLKGDKFTLTVMNICDELYGSTDVTHILQSQGTMILGEFMQDYTTTACFPDADPTLTPVEKLIKYGPVLFSRMLKMFAEMVGDVKSILMESICPNRQESYSEKIHTELAINYERASITILARVSIKDGEYVNEPHYEFSDLIHLNGFAEPAFWDVNSVEMMEKLINGIDDFIFGKITTEDFYAQFPPSNTYGYELIIDVEGFVVYDLDNENSYGKIKTLSYYKSHKLNESNVPFLCDLALVAGHLFPLAQKVRHIYIGLDEKLSIINGKLIELVTSELMINSLSPKARASYVTKEKATQFKIAINTARDIFSVNAIPFFAEQFGDIATTDEMKASIINYAMKCEIWRDIPLAPSNEFRSLLISLMINH